LAYRKRGNRINDIAAAAAAAGNHITKRRLAWRPGISGEGGWRMRGSGNWRRSSGGGQ